uniref:Uncharacterized protein n=1 Tax=Arundo donax TaxID=35708 RepID=A0A0A9CWF9_ARUDO
MDLQNYPWLFLLETIHGLLMLGMTRTHMKMLVYCEPNCCKTNTISGVEGQLKMKPTFGGWMCQCKNKSEANIYSK